MIKISENVKNISTEVISALFILLFVYAAFSKIQDFEKFSVELGKSPVLSYFAGYMAIAVPTLELIITVLLFIKRTQLIGFYSSFSLMVTFTVYIIGILNFSAYIPCSCGGILQSMTWNQHLVFNLLFIIMGAVAILLYPKKEIKDLSAVRGKAETL